MHRFIPLALVGTVALAAGCVATPGTTPVAPSGRLQVALSGPGYTVQAQGATASYQHVYFTPSSLEVHYAGALASDAATPSPIAGLESDQSASNATESTEVAAPAAGWISVPLTQSASFDLVALDGAQVVALGAGPLSEPGRYDQIRLGGTGSYETVDASGSVATGSYVLPSGRLYLSQGFEIRSGLVTDLKFSFDAARSMVSAGAKVILKPNAVKVFATYAPLP